MGPLPISDGPHRAMLGDASANIISKSIKLKWLGRNSDRRNGMTWAKEVRSLWRKNRRDGGKAGNGENLPWLEGAVKG
jgi:hypothetical protein